MVQVANDNIDPNAPIRLADAIPIAFPHGGISVSALRREASRGRLKIFRIARKDFTTIASIEEMKSSCLVPANQQDCGSGQQAKTERRSGSSSMEDGKSARAAAEMIVKRLSER